jgi:hypothetical protein
MKKLHHHPKHAAPHAALRAYHAPVGFHDGHGNGQPYACPAGSSVSGFVGTVKAFKDVGQVAFGNAYARVAYGDLVTGSPAGGARRGLGLFCSGAPYGYASGVGVFYGVGKQVDKDLHKPVIVGMHRRFGKIRDKLNSFFTRQRKELLDC